MSESQPLTLDITQSNFLAKQGKPLDPEPIDYIKTILWFLIGIPLMVIAIPIAVINFYYKKFTAKKPEKKADVNKADPFPVFEATQLTPPEQRQYDMVLYGATGFTGNLCAEYILEQYFFKTKNQSPVTIAFAGRNKSGVEKVIDIALQELSLTYSAELAAQIKPKIGILIADSFDIDALRILVNSTRSIITTVGPYDKYGTPLVALCAAYGTHCSNITGESDWLRNCITKYEQQAKKTGAILTFHAGHDCIPHDECCRLAAEELKKKHGESVKKFTIYDNISGGLSGGTLSTILHSLIGRKVEKTGLGFDPLLSVFGEQSQSNFKAISQNMLQWDPKVNAFVGPFVMAAVMGNCVKRSNAINNYGPKVVYHEKFQHRSFFTGFPQFMGTLFLGIALFLPYIPDLLSKMMPPGTGPSKEMQKKSYLYIKCIAEGEKGAKVASWCYIPLDPGYYYTARMLVETGLASVLNKEELPTSPGGVHTPSTCLGPILQKRLAAIDIQFATKTLA